MGREEHPVNSNKLSASKTAPPNFSHGGVTLFDLVIMILIILCGHDAQTCYRGQPEAAQSHKHRSVVSFSLNPILGAQTAQVLKPSV